MPTYRLTLEYEGTRYHGWQEQLNARSVQGELRRALTQAGAEIAELAGSGRTDAGVHALAQSAHLRLRREIAPGPFRRAVNDALPPDIHLLGVRPAHDGFHARHSAVSRVYLYQIACRRTALAKRFVWWVKRPLDTAKVASAAGRLEGRHDFSLFCEQPGRQPSTIVVLERAEVAESGALLLVRFTASHFLWKMVRRVVGALVRVGSGYLSVEDFSMLVSGGLPPSIPEGIAAWTAPPSGLFLERVLYAGDPPAPAMAAASPVTLEEDGRTT
ncbi:MAG TPA: tRNA pseudouridine(38-40) synthase TruA [Candidatus Polarisedimenticolia bacterium]|nr:tRNA pseudouridine(38-40) synthase TruA [Candidatus Polarisedimenticolia bacterium]